MKMPFMADDNVSGNILGGETGASDVELYRTKDHRSEAERRAEERKQWTVKIDKLVAVDISKDEEA
jgi:hypothetical protein